jgi:hypothetical protein
MIFDQISLSSHVYHNTLTTRNCALTKTFPFVVHLCLVERLHFIFVLQVVLAIIVRRDNHPLRPVRGSAHQVLQVLSWTAMGIFCPDLLLQC